MQTTMESLSHEEHYVPLRLRGGYGGSVRPLSVHHTDYVPPKHELFRRKPNSKWDSMDDENGSPTNTDPLVRFGRDLSRCNNHKALTPVLDASTQREVGWDSRFFADEKDGKEKFKDESLPLITKSDVSVYRSDAQPSGSRETNHQKVKSTAPEQTSPTPSPTFARRALSPSRPTTSPDRIHGPFPPPNQKSLSVGEMGIYRIPSLSPSAHDPPKYRQQLPFINTKQRVLQGSSPSPKAIQGRSPSPLQKSPISPTQAAPTNAPLSNTTFSDSNVTVTSKSEAVDTEKAWNLVSFNSGQHFIDFYKISRMMSPPAASKLASCATPVIIESGNEVVSQGRSSDGFFILYSGKLVVMQQNSMGEVRTIKFLKSGDCFGEISLLKNIPRTATIKATTDSVIFWIDTESFMKYLAEPMSRKRSKYDGFLSSISSFDISLMGDYERSLAIDSMEVISYKPDDMIIEKETEGHYFYIIYSGVATVSVGISEHHTPAQLKRGDYFGEVALLTLENGRTADVRVQEALTCLRWDRHSFRRYFKSCFDVFEMNMQKYIFDETADNQQVSEESFSSQSPSQTHKKKSRSKHERTPPSDRRLTPVKEDMRDLSDSPLSTMAESSGSNASLSSETPMESYEPPPTDQVSANFRSSLMELPPVDLIVQKMDAGHTLDTLYENRRHSYAAMHDS